MKTAMEKWGLTPFFFVLIPLLGGCATYGDWVGQMEDRIVREDPQGALRILESNAGNRSRDEALLLLNRAMLLRMQGDLDGSTAAFEQAKPVIDALLAVSVTEQAGALAVSDVQRSYIGEPFERVYLHVFAALNYLDAGDFGRARVEALQLDVLLGELGKDPDFRGDAFARWLSGMIFEALGENSDAMIAYRKAREAYQRYPESFVNHAPQTLGRDLVRLAERLGLADEARRFRELFAIQEQAVAPGPGDGEVILLLGSGLAPVKRETGIVAPTLQGRLVSISMPYYLSRRPWVTAAVLESDELSARAELAEDIDALAIDALEQRKPAILSRAVARAAIKHEASRAAGRESELVGFVVNIAGVVSERADTRSWSTLPNQIHVARLPLPAGVHVVDVELRDRSGRPDIREQYLVEIEAGEKRFISMHRVTRQDLYPRRP
jgi:uncharacterized protein